MHVHTHAHAKERVTLHTFKELSIFPQRLLAKMDIQSQRKENYATITVSNSGENFLSLRRPKICSLDHEMINNFLLYE